MQSENQQIPMSQRRHRFTVAEFEKAYEAGAFGTARVELIEGEVIQMPPMGDGHYSWLATLTTQLVMAFVGKARVISQAPIKLYTQASQPEPDFVVIAVDQFDGKIAMADRVAIVIEISDSTLQDDRDIKTRIYASNGVKEYWILNVKTAELEVYRDPEGETYRTKFTLSTGQSVTPLEFPQIALEWWA